MLNYYFDDLFHDYFTFFVILMNNSNLNETISMF